MTVKIEIFTKNLELTERLNNYVETKVEKLEKFLEEVDESRVDLSHAKTARNANDRYVAQITLRGRGFILRSEERSDSIFSAWTALTQDAPSNQTLQRQTPARQGDGQTIAAAIEVPEEDYEIDELPIVVRRKRFMLTPMDEQEAIEQMKLLGA